MHLKIRNKSRFFRKRKQLTWPAEILNEPQMMKLDYCGEFLYDLVCNSYKHPYRLEGHFSETNWIQRKTTTIKDNVVL